MPAEPLTGHVELPSLDVAAEAAASSGVMAIDVVGVKKYFGVTRALDGCNFSARLGEIHAIVGGNGSGKSTLAKVLSGVLPADAGRVAVLGRTPTSPYDARDMGIAMVFQEVLVAEECSVVDNLFMGADALFSQTIAGTAKLRAASALMEELAGVPVDVQALAGPLPLNLKQWITIGRALLRKPRVLILDESSAALDLDSTERLFARMRSLRDEGAAVLIVTHRIAELVRISDRATVMRDGRDVGVLEKRDITEKNLLALMTGRTEEAAAAEQAVTQSAATRADVVLRVHAMRLWRGSAPIDFALRKGEIVGVAGLDGQGQSDFVRQLACVDAPAQGVPQVRRHDGAFVSLRRLEEATAHGVAYVSGDRKREGIFANLSIFENALLPLYRGKARGGVLGIIDWKALEGIFNFEAQNLAIRMGARTNRITSLSGGNQQKVLIARSFAMDPAIMILNDPARGIDMGAKTELYRHLRNFAAQGRSVIYMSSELEEFIGFCSRVLVFRDGAIFDAFAADELDPAAILEAMFGHRAPHRTHAEAPAPAPATAIGNAAASVANPLRASGKTTTGRLSPLPWGGMRSDADPAAHGGSPVATRGGTGRPPAHAPVAPPSIRIIEFDGDEGHTLSGAERTR